MTPALNSLDGQSKAINAMVEGTGPFFDAATPALVSLGDFGDRARTLFPAIRPLIADLDELGQPLTSDDEQPREAVRQLRRRPAASRS